MTSKGLTQEKTAHRSKVDKLRQQPESKAESRKARTLKRKFQRGNEEWKKLQKRLRRRTADKKRSNSVKFRKIEVVDLEKIT